MRSLLCAVLLAGSGCGPGPGLDPAFSGTWTGPVTVLLDGLSPLSYDGTLSIAAIDGKASLSTLCPSGSSPATLNGVGSEIMWSGTWHCPTFSTGDCASIEPVIASGRLDLESDTTLSGHSFGTATGCGVQRQMTVTLALHK